MFFDNEISRSQAFHLMQHIIRIVSIFFGDSEMELWQGIRQDIYCWRSGLREFKKADRMVDILESQCHSSSFDSASWAILYRKYISEVRDELNL